MSGPSGRIQAVDWLRGIAVLFMLQTHAIVLLQPELQTGPFFWKLTRLDGLVAPAFLLAAGFALALVQVRGARSTGRAASAKKSAKRIFEVWQVATLVNLAWFPVLFEPNWLLRLDVLHCIVLSLLLALPFLVWLSPRPQVLSWVMAALGALVFASAPLLESVREPFGFLVNQAPWLPDGKGSLFSLAPWAGYVFVGASAGAIAALRDERRLWRWVLGLMAAGGLAWYFRGALKDAYPPHAFWVTNPSDAGQRLVLVLGALLTLRLVELKRPGVAHWKPVRLLTLFGTSSLGAYFFHEMVLFYRVLTVFSMAALFRGKANWPAYWALVVVLVVSTWGLILAWERVWPLMRARIRVALTP